jgi:hypothetical protein
LKEITSTHQLLKPDDTGVNVTSVNDSNQVHQSHQDLGGSFNHGMDIPIGSR